MRSSVMGGEKNYYVTALAGNFFNLILLCQRVRSLARLTLGALVWYQTVALSWRDCSDSFLKMMAHLSSDRLLPKSCESIWEWRQLGVRVEHQQIQFGQVCHFCCCLVGLNFGVKVLIFRWLRPQCWLKSNRLLIISSIATSLDIKVVFKITLLLRASKPSWSLQHKYKSYTSHRVWPFLRIYIPNQIIFIIYYGVHFGSV